MNRVRSQFVWNKESNNHEYHENVLTFFLRFRVMDEEGKLRRDLFDMWCWRRLLRKELQVQFNLKWNGNWWQLPTVCQRRVVQHFGHLIRCDEADRPRGSGWEAVHGKSRNETFGQNQTFCTKISSILVTSNKRQLTMLKLEHDYTIESQFLKHEEATWKKKKNYSIVKIEVYGKIQNYWSLKFVSLTRVYLISLWRSS